VRPWAHLTDTCLVGTSETFFWLQTRWTSPSQLSVSSHPQFCSGTPQNLHACGPRIEILPFCTLGLLILLSVVEALGFQVTPGPLFYSLLGLFLPFCQAMCTSCLFTEAHRGHLGMLLVVSRPGVPATTPLHCPSEDLAILSQTTEKKMLMK
jgi:hypothetical protein